MKILRLVTLIMLLGAFVASAVPANASKAQQLLEKADGYAQKARRLAEKDSAARDENYEKAIEKYKEISSDFPGTLQDIKSQYAIASIYNEAEGDLQDYYTSYDMSKTLVNTFDKQRTEYKDKLTSTEFSEAEKVVEKARALKKEAAEHQNKINSKTIQYKILDFLMGLTGKTPGFSYWFTLVALAVIVKILLNPLTKAQFKSTREIQKISPLIKEIQEKHKGDQKVIGEKTMELYKEHNINPFASCLPLIAQMPILIAIFYAIKSYSFQFVHGSFLWIGSGITHLYSLPVPFQAGKLVYVTAANLQEPDLILVALYVISMLFSMKMSNPDPSQAEQQKVMSILFPLMFAFIFLSFESAFILYWLTFNVVQTAQQYLILRSADSEAIVAKPENGNTGGDKK